MAKMQKKNALLAEGDDEEEADEEVATTGEAGGAKEPNHSGSSVITKCAKADSRSC